MNSLSKVFRPGICPGPQGHHRAAGSAVCWTADMIAGRLWQVARLLPRQADCCLWLLPGSTIARPLWGGLPWRELVVNKSAISSRPAARLATVQRCLSPACEPHDQSVSRSNEQVACQRCIASRPTCQYLEEQRSTQLFSPTLRSPSLYLKQSDLGSVCCSACSSSFRSQLVIGSTYLRSMHFS